MKHSILIAAVCLLPACSTRPAIETDPNIRVSVSGEGVINTDFNNDLVHRIYLSHQDIDPLKASSSPLKVLGYKPMAIKDSSGKIVGIVLNLKASNDRTDKFGFRHGDLIIGINEKSISTEDDLVQMFRQIDSSKETSISIEREGVAHKLLYYLEGNNDKRSSL